MERRQVGVVVNGVTGRMGYRQHLVRSLLAIREQGGLPLADGRRLWPEPILVGRNAAKLREIAARHGLTEWCVDLGEALRRPDAEIYFDAQVTSQREKAIRLAIEAGKHIYTEKPTAEDLASAVDLARTATAAVGVVIDTYHLWWDDRVWAQLEQAGDRIACFQLADWVTPLPEGVLLGRGLPGQGCVPMRRFRDAVDAVGFTGPIEVEIFNEALWRRPGPEILADVVASYHAALG